MIEITLAIVGTAGRDDDEKKLTKDSFKAMCIVADGLIKQLKDSNYPITHLVSGGSAWADHVAVKLFLEKKAPNLRLFIPCQFSNGSFEDEGYKNMSFPSQKGSKFLPGNTLNYLHGKFSRVTSINSLTEINLAKYEGAEILSCRGGFHGRNAMVAKSDIVLAMTFGNGKILKDGGTADTLRKYLARVKKEGFFDKSFHYNLNDGVIYAGALAPDPPPVKKYTY